MQNEKVILYIPFKSFSFSQKGEDDFEHFVQNSNHRLSVREPLASFFIIILSENWIINNRFLSHEITILSQVFISMFSNPSIFKCHPRLVNSRIGTNEGNELLVGIKPSNVFNLSHEVRGCNISNTLHRCQDFNLSFMK